MHDTVEVISWALARQKTGRKDKRGEDRTANDEKYCTYYCSYTWCGLRNCTFCSSCDKDHRRTPPSSQQEANKSNGKPGNAVAFTC